MPIRSSGPIAQKISVFQQAFKIAWTVLSTDLSPVTAAAAASLAAIIRAKQVEGMDNAEEIAAEAIKLLKP
jgi:hypothetical protein